MKFHLSITLIALFFLTSSFAQSTINDQCNCEKDFSFVVSYLENHYSGFQSNVTDVNRSAYENFKNQISQRLAVKQSTPQCLFILKDYLDFFKDRHLQIRLGNRLTGDKRVDEKSERDVMEFKASALFKGKERVAYDSNKIWDHLTQSHDEIEGVYENEVYQIAVLQNKTEARDYYGIITKSKTPLWEKGQVKLELVRIFDNDFQTILYLRNHAPDIRILQAFNPVLVMIQDIKKVYPISATLDSISMSKAPTGKWFQFKVINDSTTYLHIKTFKGAMKSKFDSAYKRALPIVTQKPNLLLDIRDNGGGNDYCWQRLRKYFYTQPIVEDTMEIFCSAETIKREEENLVELRKNRKAYGWQAAVYTKIKLKKMRKAAPGSFIPQRVTIPWFARPFINLKYYQQKKIYSKPEKIIVMYNRNTASASEELILSMIQSKKVLTFGENSGGYVTFGNNTRVNTPSGFVLQSATSRVLSRFKFEKTGIPPYLYANNRQDWIDQAQQLWKLIK